MGKPKPGCAHGSESEELPAGDIKMSVAYVTTIWTHREFLIGSPLHSAFFAPDYKRAPERFNTKFDEVATDAHVSVL